MSSQLKEVYEVVTAHTAFYTGGDVQWTASGTELLCQSNDTINVVDINTGSVTATFAETEEDEEEDPLYTFCLSNDNEHIITAHKSGLLKLWNKSDGKQEKMWRSSHKGPVARLAFDPIDENLASGGSDGVIRLWNITKNICTGSLRGGFGVYTTLKYHPDVDKQLVFGSADDTKIRSWNSITGKEVNVYTGHFSKVSSVVFPTDGIHMVSSGRDRVIIFWNIEEGKAIRTIPIYECIEAIILLPESFNIPNFQKKVVDTEIFVASAGEKGVIKVWNVSANRLIFTQTNSLVTEATEEGGLALTHMLYNKNTNSIAIVTADQNIIIHDLETFNCNKQMVGFSDEILDLIFVGVEEKHIIVATNSPDLKIYELETMNCEIIKGHKDIVLALAKFPTHPDTFVSSGKDNSVRLWLKDSNNKVSCIGVATRHTASVGSLSTAQTSLSFFTSVGQDNCLKVWQVPNLSDNTEKSLKCSHTELAHQSDINSVCVSPNDKMIATGSQDKTAKLFSVEDLSLLGVLRGHRRGVWCIKFSPVDQVLLTSSADCTLKLWSISELNCLKTFEGHESSVLKAEFLTKGLQIISTGGDGLLKLWNIKSSECKMSLEKHEGKVWSMAVSKDESIIITGDSDSMMVKWKDVTLEKRDKEYRDHEEMVLQEQELMNLLQNKKLTKALKLALRLERPLQVLKIINEILKEGTQKLTETIKGVNTTQKETLLKCASEWNTNNKNCHAAQLVFYMLSSEIISGELRLNGLSSLVEGALPYSQRHYERLTNLLQDLNFITYTVNCMQPHNTLA